MNDNEVLDGLKATMADVRMRRPVEDIMARGRAHRRRRWGAALATAGAAVVAAAILGAATTGRPAAEVEARPSAGQLHVQLAGFTLDGNVDGTVRLTLSHDQLADPATLERELAKAGVPAKVDVGKVCADPELGTDAVDKVVRDLHPADDTYRSGVWVIAPKAMPAGTRLSVSLIPAKGAVAGYVVLFQLIPAGAAPTCTVPSGPPGRPSAN